MLEYASWGIFVLSFLLSYSLLTRVFLSREERDLMSSIFGSSQKDINVSKKNRSNSLNKKKSSKKSKNKKRKIDNDSVIVPSSDNFDEELSEDIELNQEDDPEGDDKEATLALMNFLQNSLQHLVSKNINISSSDRFGTNLYLAGACEVVREDSSLNYDQFIKLLERVLSLIGNKVSAAKKLADNYDEYLLEPQYISIFQAGTDALKDYLKGDMTAASKIENAINEWRNPKKDSSTTDGPIAVLFTDIVGSTKLTQELGDEGAQKVLRVHNAIVRLALRNFSGKEVKHTGDGIMARFSKSHQAVESALIMIKGLKAHNSENKELSLHMRIGINAGEPIVEENDLFGSTVQMAARICDAAETDKILVSNIVRELSQGKPIVFDEAGKYGMKGIDGPVILYEPSRK
ncbi:MAG: hypothetical protein CFH01_01311 [Alphaproteobacteria bacterium MarineAlpha2_Bin1]|nr:MAG: hypothetical protein CFH01_01311 [Alphaproteobacteria bacterium MarineAlpha2_Bin1]